MNLRTTPYKLTVVTMLTILKTHPTLIHVLRVVLKQTDLHVLHEEQMNTKVEDSNLNDLAVKT